MKTSLKTTTFIIIVITLFTFGTCTHFQMLSSDVLSMYKKSSDSLQTYKNKDSLNVTKISVLESAKTSQFLELKTKDSTIIKLQNTVEQYKKQLKKPGSTVAIINTETVIDTMYVTETVVDSSNCLKLPYTREIKTKWLYLDYTINSDSTSMFLKTTDELEFVLGEERKGLFKKPVKFAQVTNNNPFSSTKDLRVYQVKDNSKKRNFALSPGIMYGYTIDGTRTIMIGATLTPERFKIRF